MRHKSRTFKIRYLGGYTRRLGEGERWKVIKDSKLILPKEVYDKFKNIRSDTPEEELMIVVKEALGDYIYRNFCNHVFMERIDGIRILNTFDSSGNGYMLYLE